jgi:hypothetical protein
MEFRGLAREEPLEYLRKPYRAVLPQITRRGPGCFDLDDFLKAMERHQRHQQVVASLFTDELKNAHIVLWWTHGKFRPAIWCEDLATAVYALALPNFSGRGGLAVCHHCYRFFTPSRVDQECCTPKCENARRAARHRARKRRLKSEPFPLLISQSFMISPRPKSNPPHQLEQSKL